MSPPSRLPMLRPARRPRRTAARGSWRPAPRGAVLLLVLVLLGVFLVALSAILGSGMGTLTGVGNFAFREAGVAVADGSVADAKAWISNSANNLTASVAGRYAAHALPDTNGDGIPANPCGTSSASSAWSCVATDTTSFPGYTVQYFIERMCVADGAITSVTTQCQQAKPSTESAGSYSVRGGNQNANRFASYPILYRVTVRTTGPRNTTVLTQALLTRDLMAGS